MDFHRWEETQYIMELPMKDKSMNGCGVTQIIPFPEEFERWSLLAF